MAVSPSEHAALPQLPSTHAGRAIASSYTFTTHTIAAAAAAGWAIGGTVPINLGDRVPRAAVTADVRAGY